MEQRGYVFGSGGIGVKAKVQLENEGRTVIGFLDNDDSKWGKRIEDCGIYAPQSIVGESYDFVAIGVYKSAEIIRQQLQKLGVAESKIIVPIEPARIFPNPIPLTAEQRAKLDRLEPCEYDSENTKAYLEKNIIIDDEEFLHKLECLKQTLKENSIPRGKVCVVSGAVQQAYGLRRSKKFDDIDVIMSSDLRRIYGEGLVILSATAEMHPQNKYRIADDEIIEDMRYHFVFRDLKFACLDMNADVGN